LYRLIRVTNIKRGNPSQNLAQSKSLDMQHSL
jgi:hypothetical protein